MGALLRVDMAMDVLSQQTFVGEGLVAEGTTERGVRGGHLTIEVITEFRVVGKECATHGAGD